MLPLPPSATVTWALCPRVALGSPFKAPVLGFLTCKIELTAPLPPLPQVPVLSAWRPAQPGPTAVLHKGLVLKCPNMPHRVRLRCAPLPGNTYTPTEVLALVSAAAMRHQATLSRCHRLCSLCSPSHPRDLLVLYLEVGASQALSPFSSF